MTCAYFHLVSLFFFLSSALDPTLSKMGTGLDGWWPKKGRRRSRIKASHPHKQLSSRNG